MRRILTIIVTLGVFAAILWLGYSLSDMGPGGEGPDGFGNLPESRAPRSNFGNRPNSGAPITGGGSTSTGALPRFGVVSERPVLDYFVDSDGRVYLIEPNGQVVRLLGSQAGALSSSNIDGIFGAGFSRDGKKIIVSLGNRLSPSTRIFEVGSKTWESLPYEIKSPTWNPTDMRVAFYNQDGVFSIDLGSPNSKPVLLLSMKLEDAVISWAGQDSLLIFTSKPSALAEASALIYNLKSKSLSIVKETGVGLFGIWGSSAGSMGLVFESFGGRDGEMSLVQADGKVFRRLNFSSLPSKCVFGGAQASSTPPPQLLCSVPRGSSALNQGLVPDDYFKKKFFTSDDFYAVDITNGKTSPIFIDHEYVLDAENLKVFGGRLFFVNRYDDRLYSVGL